MKQIRIRMDEAMHKSVKERSAALGVAMNDYAVGAIAQRLMSDMKTLFAPNGSATAGANAPGAFAPKERNRNEEERSKEEVNKKKEIDEKDENARARMSSFVNPHEHPSDDEVRNFARNVRPIPEEIVEAWLERAKESGWFAKDRHGNIIPINRNSWRILLTGFARNYTKWQKNAEGGDASAVKALAVARPFVRVNGERKKPSWMSWEQWQFEESERMANERLIAKVERVNERLAKVREEYGL